MFTIKGLAIIVVAVDFASAFVNDLEAKRARWPWSKIKERMPPAEAPLMEAARQVSAHKFANIKDAARAKSAMEATQKHMVQDSKRVTVKLNRAKLAKAHAQAKAIVVCDERDGINEVLRESYDKHERASFHKEKDLLMNKCKRAKEAKAKSTVAVANVTHKLKHISQGLSALRHKVAAIEHEEKRLQAKHHSKKQKAGAASKEKRPVRAAPSRNSTTGALRPPSNKSPRDAFIMARRTRRLQRRRERAEG